MSVSLFMIRVCCLRDKAFICFQTQGGRSAKQTTARGPHDRWNHKVTQTEMVLPCSSFRQPARIILLSLTSHLACMVTENKLELVRDAGT